MQARAGQLTKESAERLVEQNGLSDLKLNRRGEYVAWDDNQGDFVKVISFLFRS